ncbi:MAG TPA: DUF503 domain-containing protein [Tepidiformaceae bacterium]|nr:DUF503 domain-containing protein [Tepidiformaceae bacterium]
MTVGVLSIRLRIPAHSLKEKRAVVKSVVERIRGRFNASAAEVEDLDTWDLATVAVVCVSNEAAHASAMLASILAFVEGERLDAEVLDVQTELLHL